MFEKVNTLSYSTDKYINKPYEHRLEKNFTLLTAYTSTKAQTSMYIHTVWSVSRF